MSYFSETATERATRRTRVRGSLLGLAYGDALGAAPVAATPRQATAVTQLTLFTAEGLLRAWHRAALKGIGGAENKIVWESFLRWRGTQEPTYRPEYYVDSPEWPGGWLATEPALQYPSRTGPTTWQVLNRLPAHLPEHAPNHSRGADPLPRMVPVGLLHFAQPALAAQWAAKLAGLTHGHPETQAAAAWVAATVAYLQQQQPLAAAARLAAHHLPAGLGADEVRGVLELADRLLTPPKHPHEPDIWRLMGERTGTAVVLAALYHALRHPDQPETALREAASRGGRQAGALAGALLGSSLGEDAWPAGWRTTLNLGRVVVDVADDLHTEMKGSYFGVDEAWWRRYPGW